jgi:5-methylcytosine-specific restriction endonuclease McrA
MSTQKKHTTTLIDSKRKRAADEEMQHPPHLPTGAQDMLMFAFLTTLVSGLVWYVDPSDGVVVLDLTILIVQSLKKTKSAATSIVKRQKKRALETQTLRTFRAEGAGGQPKPVMMFTNAWEFLISQKGEIPQKLRAFSVQLIARIARGDRTLAAEITDRTATLDPDVRAVFMADPDAATVPLAPTEPSTVLLPSTAKRHKGDADFIKIGADAEPLEYLAKRYAMVPAQANEAPAFQNLMHYLNVGVDADKLLVLVQAVNAQRTAMQEQEHARLNAVSTAENAKEAGLIKEGIDQRAKVAETATAAKEAADHRAKVAAEALTAAKVAEDLRMSVEATKAHDREMAKLVFVADVKRKEARAAKVATKKPFMKAFNKATNDTAFERSLATQCRACDSYKAYFFKCDIFVPTDTTNKPKVFCSTCSTRSLRAKHQNGEWLKHPARDMERDVTWIREAGLRTQCVCRSCEEAVDYMSFHAAHNIADADGGPRKAHNLRVSCFVCNNASGTAVFDEYAAQERQMQVEDLPEMRDVRDAREIVETAYEGKEVVPVHLLAENECLFPGRSMVMNWIAQPPAFKQECGEG